MSTNRDTQEDDRDAKELSRKPLTTREVFELFLYDKAVRPYLFGALGGLAMLFLILFMNGSDIGGVMVLLWGLAALLLRWIAAPVLLVLTLAYFMVFPFAVPDPGFLYSNVYQVRDSHFQMQDMILVMATLVYLRCAYRVLGIVHLSMPFESALRRKGEYPTRRPTAHIDPSEVGWLVAASFGLVIAGQVVWWLVNALDYVPTEPGFPLRWADLTSYERYRRGSREPGEFTPGGSRFFVLTGGLFFGFLFVRLVFGYWRLKVMTAAEGAMITADTSWAESHRERVRVEKWRIWGLNRAADRERDARRKERELRRKEEEKRAKAERAARDREDERDRRRKRR
jgi:hypothetical protein